MIGPWSLALVGLFLTLNAANQWWPIPDYMTRGELSVAGCILICTGLIMGEIRKAAEALPSVPPSAEGASTNPEAP